MTVKKFHTYRGITFMLPKFKDPDDPSYSYSISKKQCQNLIDLAAVLRDTPPPKFEMIWYGEFTRSYEMSDSLRRRLASPRTPRPYDIAFMGKQGEDTAHLCGTSCCAVGTAAFYNIGNIRMTKNMGWGEFASRAFGCVESGIPYNALFNGDWHAIDNTPEGAAARILFFLIEGVGTEFKEESPSAVMKQLRDASAKYKSMPIEPPLSLDFETTDRTPAVLGSGWKDYGVEKPRS